MNPDITCEQYAQPFAFLGNSLLDTMRHTGQAGLDPAFWAAFPDMDDESVGAALDALSLGRRVRRRAWGQVRIS